MADAVEAFRQHVEQEPPDELGWTERHGRVSSRSFDPVVLDFERDVVGIGRDQAGIRDSNAVSVAGEIGEHGFRARKWALQVDEPARPLGELLQHQSECCVASKVFPSA